MGYYGFHASRFGYRNHGLIGIAIMGSFHFKGRDPVELAKRAKHETTRYAGARRLLSSRANVGLSANLPNVASIGGTIGYDGLQLNQSLGINFNGTGIRGTTNIGIGGSSWLNASANIRGDGIIIGMEEVYTCQYLHLRI